MFLRAGFVLAFDDEAGVGPCLIDVAFINQKLFEDVVVAPDDLFFRERVSESEDGGLFFDLYRHISSCLFEQVLIFVREQQDRFFGMVDEISSEIRLIVQDKGDVVSAGNVFGGDNSEFIPREIAFKRDVLDLSARGRAAHRDAVKHVRKRQVIDVERLPRDFLASLFPGK